MVHHDVIAQVIINDDIGFTTEETPVYIDVQSNDFDLLGGTLTTYFFTSPVNGTIDIIDGDSIYYSPFENFYGVDTFSYYGCNDDVPDIDCTAGYVIVSVLPTPDYPVANDDYDTTAIETPLFIDVQANDINFDPEILITTSINPPANGIAIRQPCISMLNL